MAAGWIKATRTYWTDKRQPTRAVAEGAAIDEEWPDTDEFYMPHGGTCPWCDNDLVVYVPQVGPETGERR
jgi:hypothetical protein